MRAAIYFTPPAGAPLTRAAAEWLGRGAFDGEPTRPRDKRLDPLVEQPARYGFHATMKAPFHLADDTDLADLDARLAAFCASRDAVAIDALVIDRLGSFFAFVPETPPVALVELAAAVVRTFEPMRAPMSEEDIRRRNPDKLSERQREQLAEWGYPYVFNDFRFHMTLTGSVDAKDQAKVGKRLAKHFGALDGAPIAIDRLAIFVEPEPGAPFRLHSMHPFDPRRDRTEVAGALVA
ncbi:DUF1045 domain-containing protein [Aurantimonas aggregata]|uniref:DUF1045 domain-containing protein n=1 Tax=Aurantimonas aggregata TaxID=2047720 RepID=A0A6L9MKV2_9HYPH|nr:DUF1045 domain-containing protein [Aurantimonas aggregata]NDV88467.1 DUF1045 domain-containing protein [Aurantimonas aggregata]